MRDSFAVLALFLATIFIPVPAQADPKDDAFARPPGTIIATSPDFQTIYVGSPSLTILDNGTYVASHDWFGTGLRPTRTLIYTSKDQGKTWTKQSEILKRHWSNLFVHRGKLYILGTVGGDWTIQRSDDEGKTWTEPKDSKTGLLLKGRYHTAPCPMLVHNGRLWRAFEKMEPPYRWGECFQAQMSSIPLDGDLLDADQWTFSNAVPFPFDKWPGRGWLEGNAVAAPDGKVVNVLRVQIEGGDKGAILTCSDDGKTLTYDEKKDMIDIPGGAVKFTIRYDAKSKKYWTLASKQRDPRATRNFLVLAASDNLRDWEVRTILFRHYDRRQHAWQYIDWVFEGENNIIYTSRTGWDGSHNQHDANYLTFHRIENFREKSSKDDTPWLGEKNVIKRETKRLVIEMEVNKEQKIHFGIFADGQKAFANRAYVWHNAPAELSGWKTVLNYGGEGTQLTVTAKEDTEIAIARTAIIPPQTRMFTDWKFVETSDFNYGDTNKTKMTACRRTLKKGETVYLPVIPTWTGETLIFQE